MTMAQFITGSKMPQFASDAAKTPADNSKTGYGQGGYMGASSDTDLKNPTRSALAVELYPDDFKNDDDNWQTRKVDATPITPSFGMHKNSGSPSGQVPAKLGTNEAPLPRDPNAKA